MNSFSPLISVIVITYNSAKYIVDTLESVKNQSYLNIELIVSDDCSTDDTCSLVKNWMSINGKKFVRVVLNESSVNTGTSINGNRGAKCAKGDWIKFVAGDDVLLRNSIESYVKYVVNHPQCNVCFAKLHFFGDDKRYVDDQRSKYEQFYYPFINADYETQFKEIQYRLFVPGPGLFIRKSLYEEVGGLDERFPFADEYPFTYKILESDNKIFFIDEELYGYQIRKGSLCRDEFGQDIRVFNDSYRYIKKIHIRKMLIYGYPFMALHVLIKYFRQSLRYNKLLKLFYRFSVLLYFFSPFSYKLFWNRMRIRNHK